MVSFKLPHFLKTSWALCLAIALGNSLCAAEMTKFEVQRKGKRFIMDSTLVVDAPLDAMYAILVDYNNMHQFSRGMVHSQVVSPDAQGNARVYTHLRGCVAFLCRNIERVERLETQHNSHIVTTLDPSLSKNVAWNLSTWDFEEISVAEQIEPANKKIMTKIRYQMEFEPDFWVPPLIGPYMVKKSLAEDGLEIIGRMEAHAQGGFPLDVSKNKLLLFPKLEIEKPDFIAKEQPVNNPKETPIVDMP